MPAGLNGTVWEGDLEIQDLNFLEWVLNILVLGLLRSMLSRRDAKSIFLVKHRHLQDVFSLIR